MFISKNHIIHLADGRLQPASTTSAADVRHIVRQALQQNPAAGIVIHFHGGLVSENSARETAEQRLYPLYADKAGAYPIFFVWESGFFEAPMNNLREIANEKIFREFVKKISEWVLKKLPASVGIKGAGGVGVNEIKLRQEFDDWFAGRRDTPPDALHKSASLSDAVIAANTRSAALDVDELNADITDSIEGDPVFQEAVTEVYNGLQPRNGLQSATRSEGTRVASNSQISKEAADRLFEPELAETTRGFGAIAWWKVAKVVAAIVLRVIRRFRAGRAHGPYVTLVEEALRELYIDKIGRSLWWDRMKKDTADAFTEGNEYGGHVFLSALKEELEGVQTPPRITLVGHSTGAIYICHLLRSAARLLPNQQFDVLFEAPAATHALMAATVAEHGGRISHFRQFAMCDEREAGDTLVPILYCSSLLYFVSGMLENEPDEPLVGMQRYLSESDVYNADAFPNIQACREFYAKYPNSLVWSPSVAGDGRNSDGRKHGDFDDEDLCTMGSVAYILQHGY
ncbi:hypothetical protein [Hahella sp. HN01]|uniref:hypothetical protein n=1 Tax=Hahella sp. HN01 TaxID=2847262 RepID=UPI001C1ED5E1|nr:hypothetical protein [Hahella sp. HN01]MBU6951284.1 hypothetical protein [Hahella sp. HN01]